MSLLFKTYRPDDGRVRLTLNQVDSILWVCTVRSFGLTNSQDQYDYHMMAICVINEFLGISEEAGYDMRTPNEDYVFPSLKEGDIWCLCAQRWAHAL